MARTPAKTCAEAVAHCLDNVAGAQDDPRGFQLARTATNVRDGQKRDSGAAATDVCFIPICRHQQAWSAGPFCAIEAIPEPTEQPTPVRQVSLRQASLDQPFAEKLSVVFALKEHAVAHVLGDREIRLHPKDLRHRCLSFRAPFHLGIAGC
jgi:hypothetical protein